MAVGRVSAPATHRCACHTHPFLPWTNGEQGCESLNIHMYIITHPWVSAVRSYVLYAQFYIHEHQNAVNHLDLIVHTIYNNRIQTGIIDSMHAYSECSRFTGRFPSLLHTQQ